MSPGGGAVFNEHRKGLNVSVIHCGLLLQSVAACDRRTEAGARINCGRCQA